MADIIYLDDFDEYLGLIVGEKSEEATERIREIEQAHPDYQTTGGGFSGKYIQQVNVGDKK